MSQAHLTAFLADLRSINPGININNLFGTRTSLAGLITHLQNTVNNPVQMTSQGARQHCANPLDPRIQKYVPALQRLVSVWGRGAHRQYPQAAGFVHVDQYVRQQAQTNFNNLVVPGGLKPAWAELENYDDDPYAFGFSLGAGYLHRVALVTGNLDITSRSMLLRAGLAPPVHETYDNGYIAKLDLTATELGLMANHSILDIGCGAAMFRAEMEELYNCNTTGLDMNHFYIAGAVNNAKSRYVKSILYLKMMSDLSLLAKTNVPPWTNALLATLIQHIGGVLTAFENNLPQNGDIFALAAGHNTWDFSVCMYLLCYFNAGQQTNAVMNLCRVTHDAVFLHNGSGSVLSNQLLYDQHAIQHAFPACRIVVRNPQTHHIYMH